MALEQELASAVEMTEEWGNDICISGSKKVVVGKCKSSYVDEATIGNIIAFSINETKALSGMIEEISSDSFVVKTKNGITFTVLKKNVLWVKTAGRWPRGIYLALKGEAGIHEYRRDNQESIQSQTVIREV